MQEIYQPLPYLAESYQLALCRDWGLPGVICPICGPWGETGSAVPSVDPATHSNTDTLKGPNHLPLESFRALRASLYSLSADCLNWGPATGLGPARGNGFGKPSDFCFANFGILLVEAQYFPLLQQEFGVKGALASIRWRRKNAPTYVELELPATLDFDCDSHFKICEVCGRRGGRIPDNINPVTSPPGHLWRGRFCTTRVACSRKFKERIEELRLGGIVFRQYGRLTVSPPARSVAIPLPQEEPELDTPFADFDFARWVATAASHPQIKALPPVSRGPQNVPAALRAFLELGSAGLQFIRRNPDEEEEEEDGATMEFCDANLLDDWRSSCQEWGEETWIANRPEELAMWTRSFPFVAMLNGDYLALDQSDAHENPAVLYLCHEGNSYKIARSFTQFLTEWERLGYPGPESWIIEPFLNEDGMLDSETDASKNLRAC